MTTQNSDWMTNHLASPTVKNDVGVAGGRMRVIADSFACTGTSIDATGDIIRLCRLPERVRIYEIYLNWEDFGTTLTAELGLYDKDGNALDSDAYSTSLTLSSTATTLTTWYNYRFDGGAQGNIGDMGQMVYEDAGQSVGTYEVMDLCLTMLATPSTITDGQIIDFMVKYVED